ncbi:MAG: hypothetical protein K2M42_08040 [Oscillospiraceae bacterium]|nr:hypothetical protein [Oscillospiraceae bacterium]
MHFAELRLTIASKKKKAFIPTDFQHAFSCFTLLIHTFMENPVAAANYLGNRAI